MVDRLGQYEGLNKFLNLSTYPVGIKYFSSFDEDLEWEIIDLGFSRPKNPINLCQFIGLARHLSRSVLITAHDIVCKIGAAAVGLHPFDEDMKSGEICNIDCARKDPVLCRELFRTMPRIKYGEVKAIACAPFHKMNLEIDQVLFYGTPLQILKIIQAYLWGEAARLEFSTCAKYGVCMEAMANTYITQKPCVGFSCKGERVSSMVYDSELFICVPIKYIDGIIEGLEKTKHLLPTPMPFRGLDQTPTLPDHYLTEYAKRMK
jgi:uncharacterized protein (DUF169 family)